VALAGVMLGVDAATKETGKNPHVKTKALYLVGHVGDAAGAL
jgi:hypothetical protein